MKKHLVLAAAVLAQASVWAATYTYAGPPYTAPNLHNFSNCIPGYGSCGAYTTAMAQSGWFTTAAPVPANLNNQDITVDVTAFSFSDGLTTYSSGDPQVALAYITATTTGGGLVFTVNVQRWQTPGPHAQGDHLDTMNIHFGGTHNAECSTLPVTNAQGAVMCGTTYAGDVFSSWRGNADDPGTWTFSALPPVVVPPAPNGINAVPTLSEWSLLLLAGLLGGLGYGVQRWRQRRSA